VPAAAVPHEEGDGRRADGRQPLRSKFRAPGCMATGRPIRRRPGRRS
jgi:hypothetical protein